MGPLGLKYMGDCHNYGPFLGTLNIRCRMIIGTQKGTIILTTTHILCRYMDPLGYRPREADELVKCSVSVVGTAWDSLSPKPQTLNPKP